jgi:hypothetical protein
VNDIYHLLSIMWGNAPPAAQGAFQADISKFNGYVSAGSALAAKLVPCVRQYQQAYPHVVLESQYYNQNNSSAFNSQAAIADPLIKAGANCISVATADQFASNSNGKVYNTYSGRPSPQVLTPTYQLPYNGAPGQPSVAVRQNPDPCIPPDTLTPNQRGAWYQANVLSGRIRCTGGYDPCANPDAPVWCTNNRVPSSSRAQPAATACQVVPDSAWPPLVQFETFTTQVANAARDGLVNDTRYLAPQFDMTQSGEGLRYMGTLLGNLGFRYLVPNASAAMRAIATKKPVLLPKPMYGWSPRGGAHGVPATPPNIGGPPQEPTNLAAPTPLPPGVTLPAVLRNTPRPLQLQEREATCGFACVKMLADTILRSAHPESFYQAMVPEDPCGYTPGTGTYMRWLPQVLQRVGIQANISEERLTPQNVKAAFQNLKNATQAGYPAIVHIADPGNVNGHYVVVDAIVPGAGGEDWVIGRDPFNLNLMDAISRQYMDILGKRNFFVLSSGDFLGNWTGGVITTKP